MKPKGRLFASWRRYILAKPKSTERFPFDPELPVYFFGKKMFAVYSQDGEHPSLSLKCIPDWSLQLRAEYPAITPGYHLNKRHWNTITLDGSVPRPLLRRLVDCSYDLVSGKLKALMKEEAKMLRASKKLK